jgi:cytochrome bd ubiquinol oxidase subunit II
MIYAYLAYAFIALSILAYVLMDGWDLGVGILFLVAPGDVERDQMMESIAPFWDGNETWLVFGGVTLLATFPRVYADALETLYLPVMVMLFALVFRGISFEFRGRANDQQRIWNWIFGLASLLASFSQGMLLGMVIQGFEPGLASGATVSLRLFELLCGLAMVAGYSLLGAAWLVCKTDGSSQIFGRKVSQAAFLLTIGTFVAACIWTPVLIDAVARRWFGLPYSGLFFFLAIGLVTFALSFWRSIWDLSRDDARLLWLVVMMTLFAFAGFGATVWPYILPYQLSIVDGAADINTLKFSLIGVVLIIPMVMAYQVFAYRVFRGKVPDAGGNYESVSPASRIPARRGR